MSIPALLLGPHLLLVVVDEDDVLEVFFFGPLAAVLAGHVAARLLAPPLALARRGRPHAVAQQPLETHSLLLIINLRQFLVFT